MASTNSLVGPDFGQDEYRFVVQVLCSPAILDSAYQDNLICAHLYLGEWFAHIFDYLKTKSFPKGASKSSHVRIQKLPTRYILLSNILYRRSYNGLILWCLTKADFPLALPETHLGSGGGHFGGKSLVYKLIHMGYYWKMMEQDSFAFVNKCPQCQQHINLIRAPVHELRSQVSPWPFQT